MLCFFSNIFSNVAGIQYMQVFYKKIIINLSFGLLRLNHLKVTKRCEGCEVLTPFPSSLLVGCLGVTIRRSTRDVFLSTVALKIRSKLTGEHSLRTVISIKLNYNFIKMTPLPRYSHVNLLHNFRASFHKNTSGELLLC